MREIIIIICANEISLFYYFNIVQQTHQWKKKRVKSERRAEAKK